MLCTLHSAHIAVQSTFHLYHQDTGGEIKSQLRRRVQNRNLTTLYESLGNHETLYESRDQLARVPRTLGNGDLINTYHEEICQAI